MPPRLGRLFPTDFAGKPPHMVGRDLGIWSIFRQQLPFPYRGFHFDVALGTPPRVDPEMEPNLIRAWEFLNARRIDALGVLPERWDIIEIRRGAGQAAIGALRMYGFLWRKDPPDQTPINLILVTDRADLDTQALAQADGIRLIQISP